MQEPDWLLKVALILAMGFLLQAVFGAHAQAQEIVLKAVTLRNDSDEDTAALYAFKHHVETRSNGAVQVALTIGSDACADTPTCLQAVESGDIDLFVTSASGAKGRFAFLNIFDHPFLLRSDRVAEQVLRSDLVALLRAQALDASSGELRLLTIGNSGGWSHIANSRRRISRPSELAELKIRSGPGSQALPILAAVDAESVQLPRREIALSLQLGRIEAVETDPSEIMSTGLLGAGLQYLTLDGHTYRAAFWWMNNASFTALEPRARQIVIESAYMLQQASFEAHKKRTRLAVADFQEKGGDAYALSAEEWASFAEIASKAQAESVMASAQSRTAHEALTRAIAAAEAEIAAQDERDGR